jgi:CheY-like chemotaxis protein
MSGHKVLTEIEQHPDWRRIPVVTMTSSDERRNTGRYYRRRPLLLEEHAFDALTGRGRG